MPTYRCYHLDAESQVIGAESDELPDDAMATSWAWERMAQADMACVAVEVRQLERTVARLDRTYAAAARRPDRGILPSLTRRARYRALQEKSPPTATAGLCSYRVRTSVSGSLHGHHEAARQARP
jgi:hypothetical protein